ncbi:MAG TPA: hypothetical protein VGO46_15460 [Gemmatimonadaceae bacterium]|jgi:hypothetical protein|nr:hypothetical protein [Gemmatimonadaceae bacterium]
MQDEPSVFKLRAGLACLVVAYGLTLYVQRHPPDLSLEAKQYQEISWQVMSGIDLKFGLQKLCWLLGNVGGMIGVVLMFFRFRSGVPMLFICPSLLLAATIFGASEQAFPDLEITAAQLLWYVTAAIWGSVVTYALVGERALFPKRTKVVSP